MPGSRTSRSQRAFLLVSSPPAQPHVTFAVALIAGPCD